jgi:hypothetical protein
MNDIKGSVLGVELGLYLAFRSVIGRALRRQATRVRSL